MSCPRVVAACLLLLAPAVPARSGPVADFRLAQAVQSDPPTRVLAFLDVWDAALEPVDELDAGSLSGTLGGRALALGRLLPFRDAEEGVAYVFSVDVSRSLSAGDFAEIRGALARWIEGLGPRDRAAVLTFGDASRVVVDFTADRAALASAVEDLAPTDGTTVLYRGLLDALELQSRRDPDLPRRRALVVLSDGLDEGSGLAPDDVLAALRERGLPLYAVGFGGAARRASLDLLLRFATQSGGRFVAARGGDFESAYDDIRTSIERVWVAELDCPQCPTDGAVQRLQVNLRLGDRVLSKGVDLRLLPPLAADAAPGVAAAVDAAAADAAAPGGAPGSAVAAVATTAESSGRWPAWVVASIVGGLLAIVGGVLAVRRAAVRSSPAAGTSAPGAAAPVRRRRRRERLSWRERRSLDVPLDSEPMVPPVALCLTVVRGAGGEGAEHRFLLRRSGVLGSGPASDFTIADAGLAAEQVELVQEEGAVWARNLARGKPTLLNGAPLTERKALASGDLVGTRDFIARVKLG